MAGTLYIVATPIGNLEDITARAARVLSEVDLIAAEDTRRTRKLLAHLGIRKPVTSFFAGNERAKAGGVIEALMGGRDVALVSDAGTPCISDPGYPLLAAAIEAGVAVVPIPGPSAIAAALSAAGLPTDRFTFAGFLPDKPGRRRRAIEGLKGLGHTLVFYVSPWKAAAVLRDCLEVLGDRKACLCRELTKVHEEFMRGDLSGIAASVSERPPRGEMTLLVSGNEGGEGPDQPR
jgi:16S rRNA (cytidine1402-2'-O)-methyltransferase